MASKGFILGPFLTILVLGGALGLYIDDKRGIIDDTDIPEYDVIAVDPNDMVVEGDIEVDTDRNAVESDNLKWTHNIVPYKISHLFPDTEVARIERALKEIESDVNGPGKKCIRFVRKTCESNYIHVIPTKDRCSSRVGMSGRGEQSLYLSKSCMANGVIMHEFVHALGFYHQQNHPDREQYVNIDWSNVAPGHEYFFKLRPNTRRLNAKYDYLSIMHSEPFLWAKDERKPVMTPKKVNEVHGRIGQRLRLSTIDVLKIQRLYKCEENTSHIKMKNISIIDACSFKYDLCYFTNDPDADFQWVIHSGGTQSGPLAGSTTGLDAFALARANGHQGKVARLLSRDFDAELLCMNLFLYNYHTKGTIQILARPAGTNETFVPLQQYHGQKYQQWYHLRLQLRPKNMKNYQLAIQANIEGNDIAIDDVNIYPGQC